MSNDYQPIPQPIQDLISILQQESQQLEAARQQLQLKQQALVSGAIDQLPPIDRQLSAIGKQCATLSRNRDELARQSGWGQRPLKQIIAELPAQYVPRLSQLREQLTRLARDVEQSNRETRDLLTLSLKWTQDTIAVVRGALNPDAASYNAHGEKQAKAGHHTGGALQSTISHSA